MDEFEWFGLSNGQAIVRHYMQGHVYRFRPSTIYGWRKPQLIKKEAGSPVGERPEHYIDEAAKFAAEQAQSALYARRFASE